MSHARARFPGQLRVKLGANTGDLKNELPLDAVAPISSETILLPTLLLRNEIGDAPI